MEYDITYLGNDIYVDDVQVSLDELIAMLAQMPTASSTIFVKETIPVDAKTGAVRTELSIYSNRHIFKYALGSDPAELIKFIQDHLQAPAPKAAALGETLSAANKKVK